MKQLTTYFGLAYFISWSIWLPLYGHIFGLNSLPTFSFHHGIGSLGPLLSAFLTTFIFYGTEGIKKLLKKCFAWRPLIYLIVALASPFLLAVISSIANSLMNNVAFEINGLFKTKEFPQFNFLTFFFYNLIFYGFGEEVGWRGFALPRFQNKFNGLTSSLILATFWAVWHLPLFFYRQGFTSLDIAGVFGWFFSLLTGSVLLTWLYNSSRGSILMCAVFHSTIDIAFSADFANKNIVNYMGFLITICGVFIIIIFKPKNLARQVRVKIASR
ncbi:MAG: CPBP family intramembrane metalloprotease [Chitinophagaceae bacterium]|nr:CPBP family intramembrane metalloprotease [Chitinophagaceae bacterium]OQY96547.1 MAG: CPBP family intramembrane metalloprotease [Sphingobacteriales bacterium UTBCD1]